MNKLMTSVSGVRGVFADTLNPIVAIQYVASFALAQKAAYPGIEPRIIVGRDSRTTGQTMLHAVIAALMGTGCRVTDLGIVSTPTVLLAVEMSDAIGGISITASHNPPQWNAMKFVDADGMFLAADKAMAFLEAAHQPISWSTWDNMGSLDSDPDATDRHIDKVLAIPYLDVDKIKARQLKVVIDSVNGAGGMISPLLLRKLGCTVYELNSAPTGVFSHPAEPLNENLSQLEEAVRFYGADLGFATDPDVDRLSIVSDQGKCIGEELSVALAELFVLPKHPGDVVVNLSSSMISDDIAAKYGVQVHRTKVGEINVGKKMQELKSPIGGEGNGGIICPEVHYTRDAMAGMAIILGLIAESGLSISELVASLPHYAFAKDKLTLAPDKMNPVMAAIPEILKGYQFDTQDGIKAIGDKHWIHIRKSGTEPIIRIYVESESAAESRELCDKLKAQLLSV